MSALPLAPLPVLPRPRLELVLPGFVPRPPLGAPQGAEDEPSVAAVRPAVRPAARPVASAGTVAAARPAVAATAPMRLTARGRLAVGLATFMIALSAAVGLGAAAGAFVNPGVEASGSTVVVAQGQSLWTVAASVAEPGEDVRDVAAQIAELNQLSGGAVAAGQVLRLPN